jgi:hypothetical protein
MTDPHHVLGVPVDATQDEITSAYRRLVRRYHPDTTGGDPDDRFRKVVAAYAALRGKVPQAPPHPPPFTEPAIRVGPVRYHGPPRDLR